jgi:phosphoglycerate dehydrogenase-like enzyme
VTAPQIAILPRDNDDLRSDVVAAGGEAATPEHADAIVWTDPAAPAELGTVLQSSPASWVQLPFAGIESFFAAGVIDDGHTWTCAKGVYGESTAEHALALMLAAARQLPAHLRARTWSHAGERRLKEATVVIVGTGGIGSSLTRMLRQLGARVIGVNRSGRALEGAERTVTVEHLADLASAADYIVLALALTEQTRGLVDGSLLELMNNEAWVVNVARGGLIETDALVAALRDGGIGGAALDVTDPEPLPDEHPLWGLENVIITPHVANTWSMALPELRALIRRNVEHFRRSEALEGVVDPTLGY